MFAIKNRSMFSFMHCVHPTIAFSIALSGCVSGPTVTQSSSESLSSVSGCSSLQPLEWNKSHAPKLVFLSIDSLNARVLTEYLPLLKASHPFGFKKILTHANQNSELLIHNPTITASSHTSTITCSSAGTHGIFANTQWNGQKNVSGFSEATQTETFATALTNSGLKVVTAGYPALDNSEPGRQVSAGFAYGDSLGHSALIAVTQNLATEHSWKNSKNEVVGSIRLKNDPDGRIVIECISQNCKVTRAEGNKLDNIEISLGDEKAVGYAFEISGAQRYFYISQLAINRAFPEQVSKRLSACGIVFSPGKDISLSRFGATPVILGLEHRLNFFKQSWTRFLPETGADAMFLYLEDLDALRHQFSGDTDALPQVLSHLTKVDQLLGDFLQSLPPQTNVVVMGDHGMSTVQKELNVRKILPESALKESTIYTSGGTLLLYGKKSQSNGKMNANPNKNDLVWLETSKKALMNFKLPDESGAVFETVYIKNTQEMRQAGLAHPNSPFLIAFANDAVALQDSLNDSLVLADLRKKELPVPRPRGQHGHNNQNKTMKSFLSLWGPELDALAAKQIKTNLDVVPAIAKALHWPVPKQCRNRD